MAAAEAGVPPNVVTYSTVAKGYAAASRLVDARRVVEQMIAAGVAPNAVTYNALIGCCIRKGEAAAAKELLGEMARVGVPADTTCYNMVIGCLTRAPHLVTYLPTYLPTCFLHTLGHRLPYEGGAEGGGRAAPHVDASGRCGTRHDHLLVVHHLGARRDGAHQGGRVDQHYEGGGRPAGPAVLQQGHRQLRPRAAARAGRGVARQDRSGGPHPRPRLVLDGRRCVRADCGARGCQPAAQANACGGPGGRYGHPQRGHRRPRARRLPAPGVCAPSAARARRVGGGRCGRRQLHVRDLGPREARPPRRRRQDLRSHEDEHDGRGGRDDVQHHGGGLRLSGHVECHQRPLRADVSGWHLPGSVDLRPAPRGLSQGRAPPARTRLRPANAPRQAAAALVVLPTLAAQDARGHPAARARERMQRRVGRRRGHPRRRAQAEPSQAKPSQVKPSQDTSSRVTSSHVKSSSGLMHLPAPHEPLQEGLPFGWG